MSRPLTIGRLDLALRDQSHGARAETLVRDALRTASFPGLPAGALIALRHFDLGEISCTQSAQSIALQIDQRFLTLPHTAVHISHDSAIHAAVVWAEDHYDALRTVAQAYYQRHPSKHAWFWPLLLSPWQHQASSAQGLTHVLTRAATQMPDPFHGLHNLFKTVSESVRSGLIQALDHKLIRWLAAALPTSSAALPLLPSDLPAAPQSLITAAHHWGAHDQRSRLLAAIWCAKSGAEQHDVASAAQSLLQQWFTPTVAKLTTVARKTTHSTVDEIVLSRALPAEKLADIPAALELHPPRSGLETAAKIVFEPTLLNTAPKTRSHIPSQTAHEKGLASPAPDSLVIKKESAPQWDGQPSSYAGAIFLILLIQRALPSTSQLTHAHLTHAQRQALIFRLARQAGTPRRDPMLSWLSLPLLPSLIASTNAERKAACRWLRQHNKGNKGNKGNRERLDDRRLTLRQLVKRPGLIRATTHHIDVTFPINSADIRIRRLGLDLNPGWVPWLGKIIGIHFQAMPNLGGDF